MQKLVKDLKTEYSKLKIKDRTSLKKSTKLYFSKYLKNPERTIKKYEHYICAEIIKYSKLKKHAKYFDLFEYFAFQYKNLDVFEKNEFIKLMESYFILNEDASQNYLMLAEQQNNFKISSKHDEVYIIMELIGNLLEKCLYKHLALLYAILRYKSNKPVSEDYSKLKFGNIINSLNQIESNNFFLSDSIYGIPLNQWRNICIHKDYELLSEDNIRVQYQHNTINKIIKRSEIQKVLEEINSLNTSLALFYNLIYLDISPNIDPKNIPHKNSRFLGSFLYLFFNIRSLNYDIKKYSYNKKENIYEVIFEDLNSARFLTDSIMFLSRFMAPIAYELSEDKIENMVPNKIKIILVNKTKFIANATIDYKIALNLYKKENPIDEIVENTIFGMNVKRK